MRRPVGDNSNHGGKGLPASVGGDDFSRGEAACGDGGGAVTDDERHDTEAASRPVPRGQHSTGRTAPRVYVVRWREQVKRRRGGRRARRATTTAASPTTVERTTRG